jgi:hypothetical protein
MSSSNPGPDNETMESLIDTNEQLQQSLNQHQRAMLYARKQLGERNGNQSQSPTGHTPDALYEGGPPSTRQQPVSAVSSSSRSQTPLPAIPPPQMPSPPSGKGKGPAHDWSAPSASTAAPSRNGTVSDRYGENENEDPFRDPEPERSDYGGGGGSARGGAPSDQPPRLAVDSFHPGFGTTPSYLGRQDSAMDKVQMHGAAGLPDGGGASAYTSAPKRAPPGRYDELEAHLSEDDDDDDRYNATPRKEGQVFRY